MRTLSAGQSAVDDGLPALAEKQLRPLLAPDVRAALTDDQAVQACLLLARALHDQGKHDAILLLLDSRDAWIRKLESGTPFAFWRALAAYERKETAASLAELADFESRYKGTEYASRAVRLRGLCLLQHGDRSGAYRQFDRFERDYPDHVELPACLLDWGQALIEDGSFDEARAVLERLAAAGVSGRKRDEGRYWLGYVLGRSGHHAQATNLLSQLGNDTNAWKDLRARAWATEAPLQLSATNRQGAVQCLEAGWQHAETPELKRDIGFQLGHLLLEVERIEDGVGILKQLITAAPQDSLSPGAQLSLAWALLRGGNPKQASEEFLHYVEAYSDDAGRAQAYEGRGWALFRTGRYAEAATAFENALQLAVAPEKREECLLKVGDSYLANGQFQLASETYNRLLADYPQGRLVPNAMLQTGVCQTSLNEIRNAEVTFNRVVSDFPESSASEEAMLRLAQIKESQDQWIEAIANYERLMTAYPKGETYVRALHGRGVVRHHLYRFAEALQDFETVVSSFPDSSEAEHAFLMRGMCFYGLWQDETALGICNEFLVKFPESRWAPEVLFWLGKYAYNQGDYESAQQRFVSFVEKYPAHELADDCLLRAGLAAAKRKEYRQSVETLNRIVKEYPDSPKLPETRFAQAEALVEMGDYSAAILMFDEIVGRYPDHDLVASAWCRKGDCQFTLGTKDPQRFQESIESYRVVANSSRASADTALQAEYKIGRCFEKTGKTSEAFEQYYVRVILRYLDDREKGVPHNEGSKVWFTRAAFNAADMMEAAKDWRRAVRILERVVGSGVPAADEAAERMRKIKAEHWWLFY